MLVFAIKLSKTERARKLTGTRSEAPTGKPIGALSLLQIETEDRLILGV
jgi:hypothetical protein